LYATNGQSQQASWGALPGTIDAQFQVSSFEFWVSDTVPELQTPKIGTMAAPSSSFLLGKLALVTGGSGTIGQAIAKVLLSQGASVVLTARRMEKLELAKEKLQKEVDKAAVHVIASDVSKEESVVNLFQEIDQLEHGKGLDLLVNNAGECHIG
jgi:NADPH:quinone reductase-like Zn-dependent oxidoreductase